MASPMIPLSELPILDLTQRVLAQDARWGDILTRAQSTHQPQAAGGIDFFKKIWRPVMGSYLENVAAKYDPAVRVPAEVLSWLLNLLTSRVYPAALGAGFTDRTFLFPSVTFEQSGHPGTIAGAEAEPARVDWKGWGFLAALFGAGYFFVARPMMKKQEEMQAQLSAISREAGIQKGMSATQRDAAWDKLYAKYGLQLKNGELVKI